MSSAAQQLSGIKRTDLRQHDLHIPGRELLRNRVDISPEARSVRHNHPGEQIIYVLEGSLEYRIDGESARSVRAGEASLVPAETVHAVKNVGTGSAPELATYVVEQGKPLLSVVE